MKEAIAGLRHTPEVPARLRPRFMVKVEKQTRPQECAPGLLQARRRWEGLQNS